VRRMQLVTAMSLLAMASCDRSPSSQALTPEAQAFRTEVVQALKTAKFLTLTSFTPIPDGGTIEHLMVTDTGFSVRVDSYPVGVWDDPPPKRRTYGINIVRPGPAEICFSLENGSLLATQLLALLQQARLNPTDPEYPVTAQTRDRLVSRIRMRKD
jgi:hypothetical protein